MTAVRPARPADRPHLARLQSALPEPSPDLLDHGLRTGGVLVATADGAPVGYLLAVGVRFGVNRPRETRGSVARIETDETSDGCGTGVGSGGKRGGGTGESAPSAHLAELAVAPARRRQGHGGALLDALLSRAGHVTVTVAPDNDAALALYRSRGFERVDRRPDAFESGPALVLATTTRAGRPSEPERRPDA